jgi:hypothetical protein
VYLTHIYVYAKIWIHLGVTCLFHDFNKVHLCRSVSQILPRPARPIGFGRSYLQSTSSLRDWDSDTSTSKRSESFQKTTKLSDGLQNKEYEQKGIINGRELVSDQQETIIPGNSGKVFDGHI